METTYTTYSGDSKTLLIPMLKDGVLFVPGSAYSLIFTAKEFLSDDDVHAKIQKRDGAGISTAADIASIALVPQDTAALSGLFLCCDIQAQHLVSREVFTVAMFRLKVRRDVTRQTTPSIPIYTIQPPLVTAATVQSVQGLVKTQVQFSTNMAADYIGQWCRVGDLSPYSFWQSETLSSWVPRIIDGCPVAYNSTQGQWQKIGVSGDATNEFVTLSTVPTQSNI